MLSGNGGTDPGTDGSGGNPASGGGDAGSGGQSSLPPAPRVLSFVPADFTRGVWAEGAIELEFSKAMDQASVKSHFSVSGFSVQELEFDWKQPTKLEVTARQGFPYEKGSDSASTEAREFSWSLSQEARDVDGRTLEEAVGGRFSTLRRIVTSLEPEGVTRFDTYSYGNGGEPVACPDDFVRVGSFSTSSAGGTRYTYVAYDASDLDDWDAVVAVQDVRFLVSQEEEQGDFYDGGELLLQRLFDGSVFDRTVMDLAVEQELGFLAKTPASRLNLDLTEVFDSSKRHHVYRLSPGGEPPPNSATTLSCWGFALDLTYLVP